MTDCAACSGAWLPVEQRIEDCGLAVAYLAEDQFFPGWTILVLKGHATELFQLSREDRGELMEEVSRLARALSEVFRPRKLNYELLGNQQPHIHWHIIPRLTTDPAPSAAVWTVPHDVVRLSLEEQRMRAASIRSALDAVV